MVERHHWSGDRGPSAFGTRIAGIGYRGCLCRELSLRQVPFQCEVALPVIYKGITLDHTFRLDLVVDDRVIVELKSVAKIEPVFEAQLLSYLRLANLWLGLLINFNVEVLKTGIKRLVNG